MPGSRRGGPVVVLALCLAAASSYEEISPGMREAPSVDPLSLALDRFEELKTILQYHGVVCFLSDMDLNKESGQAGWFLAGYAVAPVVLRRAPIAIRWSVISRVRLPRPAGRQRS